MPESLTLADAGATEAAGVGLAAALIRERPAQLCIYLSGELGAGKTTLVRGFLRGLGHLGRVPSPTYTLVEPYELADYRIAHLDLYRLSDGAELEFLGIAELAGPGTVLLVEWPERALDQLPDNDLDIKLKVISEGRSLEAHAASPAGQAVLAALAP